jgi:hypothetical protein
MEDWVVFAIIGAGVAILFLTVLSWACGLCEPTEKQFNIPLELAKPRPLGITVTSEMGGRRGVQVSQIPAKSPLYGKGLRVNDRIVAINGEATIGCSLKEFSDIRERHQPQLTLTVRRGGGSGVVDGDSAKPSRRNQDQRLVDGAQAGIENSVVAASVRRTSVSVVEDAQAEFSKYDKDGSDTINLDELKTLLSDHGHSDVDPAVYLKYDANGDGLFQFEEFVHIFNELVSTSDKPNDIILYKTDI